MTWGASKRGTIVLDPAVPVDEIHVGGVVVVSNPSLEVIGWLASGQLVRVPNHVIATGVEAAAPDVQFRRLDPVIGEFMSPGV